MHCHKSIKHISIMDEFFKEQVNVDIHYTEISYDAFAVKAPSLFEEQGDGCMCYNVLL